MKGRRLLDRWRKPRDATEDALWPRAMSAGRAAATALTLLVFVASLTLDDLRLFRFSSAFVGGALAVVVFAFTPPLFASGLVGRAIADAPGSEATWMENALVRRRALLGLAVALLVLWLVFFASGRTPRW
jgi:hypothetical protein